MKRKNFGLHQLSSFLCIIMSFPHFRFEHTKLSWWNVIHWNLSSMHNDSDIDKSMGDLKNLEVIIFYNMMKRAVNAIDEMEVLILNIKAVAYDNIFSVLNILGINSWISLL